MNTEENNTQLPQSSVSVSVTDLRIGNYYSYDNDVIKLDGSFLAAYLQNDTDMYLYPEPINEKWLLKFGFKQDLDKSFIKNKLAIFLDKRLKNNCYIFSIANYPSQKWERLDDLNIVYVHQLQNLYSALKGSDLQSGDLTEH